MQLYEQNVANSWSVSAVTAAYKISYAAYMFIIMFMLNVSSFLIP